MLTDVTNVTVYRRTTVKRKAARRKYPRPVAMVTPGPLIRSSFFRERKCVCRWRRGQLSFKIKAEMKLNVKLRRNTKSATWIKLKETDAIQILLGIVFRDCIWITRSAILKGVGLEGLHWWFSAALSIRQGTHRRPVKEKMVQIEAAEDRLSWLSVSGRCQMAEAITQVYFVRTFQQHSNSKCLITHKGIKESYRPKTHKAISKKDTCSL